MITHEDIESFQANPRAFTVPEIRELWLSGFVNRWHSHTDCRLRNSGDMVGGHAQRVAILYVGLFLHSENTFEMMHAHFVNLMSALLHDAPERISGDIPYSGKSRIAELRIGDKAAEAAYWSEFTRDVGWGRKSAQINLCDLLDAIMFTRQRAPELLETDAWGDDIGLCLKMAEDLGVRSDVHTLIKGPL